jgi:predicted alpha/beta hydrolase
MSFNEQDRSGAVTLSAAKGLSRWAERCFATLSMRFPFLVVTFHYRPGRGIDGPLADKSAVRQYIVRLRGMTDPGC